MKDVKSIEFGFENCECFTIDAKYFGTLELMDFETQIRRNACNSISKTNFVSTVAMEIFSEGNGDYHPFGIENETMKFFDRLQEYNDIVDLTITYSDDTIESYYVYGCEVDCDCKECGYANMYKDFVPTKPLHDKSISGV